MIIGLESWTLARPELFLAAVTALLLVYGVVRGESSANFVAVTTSLALLATAVLLFVPYREGTAFASLFIVDRLTTTMKALVLVGAAVTVLMSRAYFERVRAWRFEYPVLVSLATLGMMLMISANNLIVIYLGLELQALSLYALVALRRDDARSSEAAMKYFVLGALASGFLLYGMSMIYGGSGTLDINELARRVATGQVASRLSLVLGVVFVIAGLAFKLGAVPFHMWVPDVYHGAPTPVTLLIGSAPKLAIFAVAYRILVEGLLPLAVDWQKMLVVLAVASLLLGNLTAIAQTNLKRMLAYSTIAQMGFVLLAMLSGVTKGDTAATATAYSAAMFYVVTYALTALGTFGVILLLAREGFEAEEIADLNGLNRRSPWYAFVMLLLMFSLAGIPPTVGFYAKFVVLQALLVEGVTSAMVWLAVLAVVFSVIGAFYYLRVVKAMYFDEPAGPVAPAPIVATTDMRVALSINGALVLVLGILPQYLLKLCADAVQRALGG